MNRKKLFRRIVQLILFIFVVNFFANKFFWYSSIWYLDMIMHFFGGFWIGLIFLYIFPQKTEENKRFLSLLLVKVLLFVLFVGVGWEIYEVVVDKIVSPSTFNILDTSSDIFFDLSGGVFAIFYFMKRIMFLGENRVK